MMKGEGEGARVGRKKRRKKEENHPAIHPGRDGSAARVGRASVVELVSGKREARARREAAAAAVQASEAFVAHVEGRSLVVV